MGDSVSMDESVTEWEQRSVELNASWTPRTATNTDTETPRTATNTDTETPRTAPLTDTDTPRTATNTDTETPRTATQTHRGQGLPACCGAPNRFRSLDHLLIRLSRFCKRLVEILIGRLREAIMIMLRSVDSPSPLSLSPFFSHSCSLNAVLSRQQGL